MYRAKNPVQTWLIPWVLQDVGRASLAIIKHEAKQGREEDKLCEMKELAAIFFSIKKHSNEW